MSNIKGHKANLVLIDEPKTLGTALIEIEGITHVALCGKDPINGEWWTMAACLEILVSRTVQPRHIDHLLFPTCLWCVALQGLQDRR